MYCFFHDSQNTLQNRSKFSAPLFPGDKLINHIICPCHLLPLIQKEMEKCSLY